MSDRNEQIKALKAIFEMAKVSPRDSDGWFENLDLHDRVGNAIFEVSDNDYIELKNEVYLYLKDLFPDFRAEAIQAIGWDTGLNCKEFQKNEAYEIWLNDEDEDVKISALVAWTRHYAFSKNPIVLKNLYNIFSLEKYSPNIRSFALERFINVADAESYPGEAMDILSLGDIEDQKTLTRSMDWGKINRIMQQYVPGWKK